MVDLDELDYGILHLLQQDARGQTPVEMAEDLPVTDQTIRNRIEKMEEAGVIEGYVPVVNYEEAGFPIIVHLSCTVPISQREGLATDVLRLSHVVRVEELLSSKENLRVMAVTDDTETISELTSELDDLGVTIESERVMRQAHVRPFNHFGEQMVSEH